MKRVIVFTVFIALLLGFTVKARTDDSYSGDISIMGRYVDDNDKMTKIGEYEERWSGAEAEINLNLQDFKFNGFFKDDDDWGAKLNLDIKRLLKIDGEIDRMFHYMGHEIPFPEGYPDYTDGFQIGSAPPYDHVVGNEAGSLNYNTSTGSGTGAGHKIVRFTDLNVGKDYYLRITRSAFSGSINIPSLPGLKLLYDFHRYTKTGHRQMYYMGSKCATCHVYTYGRDIDEESNTFKAGFRVTRKVWGFEYFHEVKTFEDNGNVHNFFPDPVHKPDSTANPFLGEVFYDENDHLSVNTTPDVKKNTDVLKFYLKGLPLYSKLVLSYVHSSVKSEHDDDALPDIMDANNDYNQEREDLTPDFDAFSVSFSSRPVKNLAVNAKYRHYSIDADNVNIVLYPVSPTTAGNPYGNPAQYPYKSDYVLDRSVDEYKLSFSYLLFSKYSISFGWEREDIDRDSKQMNSQNPNDPSFPNSPFTEDYDDTTTDTFFANFKGKLLKNLSFRFSFEYENVDDPFEFEKAKCPSGGNIRCTYDTWQYYRKLVGSADPEDSYTWKLSLTFTPTTSTIFGIHGKYSDQDNDKADWSKDDLSLGANLNLQPTKRFAFNIGYEYQRIKTETPVTVPIFDG